MQVQYITVFIADNPFVDFHLGQDGLLSNAIPFHLILSYGDRFIYFEKLVTSVRRNRRPFMLETKKNCWEVTKCGREPGGINAGKHEVCPASIESRADGINGGKNAGRICWVVAGTFCEGGAHGTFAKKLNSCMDCIFYQMIWQDDKDQIVTTSEELKSLRLMLKSDRS